MDQHDEATWPDRAGKPWLQAIPGHGVRVLSRPVERTRTDAERRTHSLPERLTRCVPGDDAAAIRVLVVGDDVLARRGVLAALDGQPGLVVVGEHPCGPSVTTAVRARRPNVVLLHGLRAAEAEPTVRAARVASRTVAVLSVGARDEDGDLPAPDGVGGSLPRWASADEVVAAIRMVAAGYVISEAAQGHDPAAAVARRGRATALRAGL